MRNVADLLALNVTALRKKKGWTQERLAEKADVALNTIQRIESKIRFPRQKNLTSIAKALNVSESRLFVDPDDKSKPTALEALEVILDILGINAKLESRPKDRVKIENETNAPIDIHREEIKRLRELASEISTEVIDGVLNSDAISFENLRNVLKAVREKNTKKI